MKPLSETAPSTVYGPVHSWRLGLSLGVDLLCIDSICSFECVYCQLGKINRVTATRSVFVPTEKVMNDLTNAEWQNADVITFSGSGEPTLAKNLGETITEIKKFSQKKVVVLTNSSLLNLKDVRDELSNADKVFCKLDTWDEDSFRRIDRPHADISFHSLVEGLKLLRKEYGGFMAIQTMLLHSLSNEEIERFADILLEIKPDEVQLNLPLRPIPQSYHVETRGNDVASDDNFRRLKTISSNEMGVIRNKLSSLTKLSITSR